MSKDIFFGNVMPSSLSPVSTGNADADKAIRALQAWEMSPSTPVARPSGKDYSEAVKRAEAIGPEKLLALLDDNAIATGQSRWSDEHRNSLTTAEKRAFKKNYDAVLSALAVRKAYLHWLIGAVCNTPSGLKRALEIAASGTVTARLVAASTLWEHLNTTDARRQFANTLDLRHWDGNPRELEPAYRSAVAALAALDPVEVFERYAPLVTSEVAQTPAGERRLWALLYGLIASAKQQPNNPVLLDPRWTHVVLPLLATRSDNQALLLLECLPPDPSTLAPLCACLPKPDAPKTYWNPIAVKLLARVADKRALPWLVSALKYSWMNWPAAVEGLRRAADPSMAHVLREWLSQNGAPDREAVILPVIKELEALGPVTAPAMSALPDPEPPKQRPILVYKKTRAPKAPKIDPLETQRATHAKAFEAAGLSAYFDRIVQPAVWMVPKRVDQTKLALGGTKLGGHPDLPASTRWPRVKKEALTFLAQINLAEVSALLPAGALPAEGLLSFFMGNNPEGDAGYCEEARVLYTPAGASLVRREVPDDFVDVIYQAATVTLYPALSLPSPTNRHITEVLSDAEQRAYSDTAFMDLHALPQLLGYRLHGYDFEEQITAQMLLQLPGDSQTDMEFGDADYLSFFIDKKKLAAGDFSHVWPHIGD